MSHTVHMNCYIQEYYTSGHMLCARLREKETNRIVSLTGENLDKTQFLRFLSQAKTNLDLMPTIYDRNGADCVTVTGIPVKSDKTELILDVNCVGGGYLFT